MDILGYALGALAAAALLYLAGHRAGWDRAVLMFSERVSGLEDEVAEQRAELKRLDECTLQWTHVPDRPEVLEG